MSAVASRAVEAELVKTRNFLRDVIDSSVDAIISADMKGRVLVFNRAAERVYGRTLAEVMGTDVSELYPPGGAKEVMRKIREGGGRTEGFQTVVLAADGEQVPVALSGSLLYEHDTPVGTVGIFTDLREKVRMEQRLALKLLIAFVIECQQIVIGVTINLLRCRQRHLVGAVLCSVGMRFAHLQFHHFVNRR